MSLPESSSLAATPQPCASAPWREHTDALAAVFTTQRDRLRRTVQLRLDARLVSRIEPEDVLQESYLEARKRFDQRRGLPGDSLFVWARMVVEQTVVDVARRHLGARKRAVGAEVPLDALNGGNTTSFALRDNLLSLLTTPTQAAARAELHDQVAAAIGALSALDREILLLRHFEELSNNETAAVLGIHKAAATNRYLRALRRLREVLHVAGVDA